MPVLLSSYPSSRVFTNWDYWKVPHPESSAYRWHFNRVYEYNRFIERPAYLSKIRKALPARLHAKLLDSFDQDHAMFISEGTKHALF